MSANPNDLATLQSLLTGNITPYEGGKGHFGCFFFNTIVENAALQIPAFKEQTDGHFNDVRSATRHLINRAKAKGKVREDLDSDAAGEFMAGALMAISLISRDARDVTAASGYVEMANAMIETWRR